MNKDAFSKWRPWPLLLLAAAIIGLGLTSCAQPPEVSLPPTPTTGVVASATLSPTQTPAPPSNLFICLAQEPASLYLYADTNRQADIIFQALYQSPVELVDYEWRSDILEKIPSLADGDAQLEAITVGFGDVYLNPQTLEPDRLGSGDTYLPAGCQSLDCAELFQGGRVEMDRLSAQFRLKADQFWSDGEPLTVADSIFSFETAGHPDTPTSKFLFNRTFAYRQLDELTVEWVGIPGFLDADYASNFWTPLPQHQLGQVEPVDLLGLPESSLNPMGYGPYQIEDWQQGRQLIMSRNPEYLGGRADSPGFDRLVFRFLGDDQASALDQLATGECDVLDESLLPLAQLDQTRAALEASGAVLQLVAGSVVERLEFALRPAIDSQFRRLLDQPELRQALASCIDRPALAENLFGPAASVPVSFLPAAHPQSSAGEAALRYDPELAQQILDDLGWLVPKQGDIRVALGVEGLANDTPLTFNVLSLPGDLQLETLDFIERDLAQCGIGLEVETLPADQLFEPWPDGPLFSRRFQMALWAWPTFHSPACEMFASWEFPSQENPLGINASGFNEPAYDQACRTLLSSPSGTPAYDQAIERLQQEFLSGLPALPLYSRPRQLAHVDWLCGPEPSGSASTMYWNLEEWAPCP